ncbi:hypothetical protein C8J30_101379 [Rhodobacter viridis]|uniref:Helix-turn-helix protein n=1 Tax=Rhodobacter viridis TaxID=1054202 RepID=A0A318U7Q3_9RHOB|nr:hypothetical protein [Rhodobacter viridis]PYF12994.1 hypothetical protein C8J30_101379 [Rhodobacter viridis]
MPSLKRKGPEGARQRPEAIQTKIKREDTAKPVPAQAASPLAWLQTVAAVHGASRLTQSGLRPVDLYLAVWLAGRLDHDTMTAKAGSGEWAAACGVHPQGARGAIKRLREAGLLCVVGHAKHEGRGRPANIYLATMPAREVQEGGVK